VPIYWSLKSIPELSQLSPVERRLAWGRVHRKTLRHWQAWAGLGACGVCGALGAGLGSSFAHLLGYFPYSSTTWPDCVPCLVFGLIGAAIGGGFGGLLFRQAQIHVARLHYKNELSGVR